MGFFDTIFCEANAPGAELLGDREFQTKDLGRRMDHFTITVAGELIHHCRRPENKEVFARHVAYRDVLVPLHRDITLCGATSAGEFAWFVARFTDGKLQWVCPLEHLSEDHREYLRAGD